MSDTNLRKEPEHLRLQAPSILQDSSTKLKSNQGRRTILVVEDNVSCMRAAKLLLQPLSCKIVTLTNAEAALKYLAEYSDEVVLILTDIDLPGMSGLKFLSKIKTDNRFKKIPVILQSGTSAEEMKKGTALGAGSYVQKPYTKEDLYGAIDQINFNSEGVLCATSEMF